MVSRNQKKALITDPEEVLNHIYKMVSDKKVKTISGIEKEIKADTFCIHGDNKNSLEILKYVIQNISKKGIEIG